MIHSRERFRQRPRASTTRSTRWQGDAVGRELIRLGVTADRLTPDERMQIIASLETGGIFLLKGAVKDVADALHCSQASVYRYLSQIKKDDSNSASDNIFTMQLTKTAESERNARGSAVSLFIC